MGSKGGDDTRKDECWESDAHCDLGCSTRGGGRKAAIFCQEITADDS